VYLSALPSRRQATVRCLIALLTALGRIALGTTTLAAARSALLALLVLYGFAPTVFAACRLPTAIFVLRRHRRLHRRLRRLDAGERELVVALRRHLDELPETQHPLGL
jgi:predicted transcriptional regulator